MPESLEGFAELANIRDELDEQGTILDALVRDSGVRAMIMKEMEDPVLRDIFLSLDTPRTQATLLGALKATDREVSQATVSRKLDHLIHDLGLVRTTGRDKAGTQYAHTRLARALKLARTLAKLPASTKTAASRAKR